MLKILYFCFVAAVSESVVDDPFQHLVIDEDQSKSEETEPKTAVDRYDKRLNASRQHM